MSFLSLSKSSRHDRKAVSLTKNSAAGRGSKIWSSGGYTSGAEHRELRVFLQSLGLNYKTFNRKMTTLHVTSHDNIANVQVAEPNAFEEKGVFTSSMPFTCCPKKQVPRLHQKKPQHGN